MACGLIGELFFNLYATEHIQNIFLFCKQYPWIFQVTPCYLSINCNYLRNSLPPFKLLACYHESIF